MSSKRPIGEDLGLSKKVKRLAIRIWSKTEEFAMAEYISEHPYLGKNQAKETLIQYLRKMISAIKITNCDDRQIQNKYMTMKRKYEETHRWINETGQGVQTDNPAGFADIVSSKFHCYYQLATVWGTSQAVNTSYQRDAGEVVTPNIETGRDAEIAEENELEILTTRGIINPEDDEEAILDLNTAKSSMAHSATKFESAILAKSKGLKQKTSTITDFLIAREQYRMKIEEDKLNWEKEKWNAEQEAKVKEREMQLEIEKQKAKYIYDLEIAKLNMEKEIQLKTLESDSV